MRFEQRQPHSSRSAAPVSTAPAVGIQRKSCACGGRSRASECEECGKKGSGGRPRIQRQASDFNSGDSYEQEADRIAAEIVRGDTFDGGQRGGGPFPVRDACASSTSLSPDRAIPAVVREVLRSEGEPLAAGVRAFFETKLGYDFSSIRIHAGDKPSASAAAVDARAYTFGRHLVFGAGEYEPATREGRLLLAHELIHSVQQGAAPRIEEGREAGRALPGLAISRDPAREVRRWKIAGTEARAEKDGESLRKLARSVGAEGESWQCIVPLEMSAADGPDRPADFNRHYERHVSENDRFDVSNLLASNGPSVSLHILNGAAANTRLKDFLPLFYPGIGYMPSAAVDEHLREAAASGMSPVRQFVIAGHVGGGASMMSDPEGNGRYSPQAVDPSPPPSFLNVSPAHGVPELPRPCWFTRDASVRAVGCDSAEFGVQFAKTYLRKGAEAAATTAAVHGSILAPGAALAGLEFAEESFGQTHRLEGPFFNAADFHAASHWAVVAHRAAGWKVVRPGAAPKPRRAAALLGETGEADVATVRGLLDPDVSPEDVRAILSILRAWGDEERIRGAWLLIGRPDLERFVRNLEMEHFVSHPLEVLASLSALDESARQSRIREAARGVATPAQASTAFFLVLQLDPADAEDRKAFLGGEGRARRRARRIGGKIQAALPYAVRKALVEALSPGRDEAGVSFFSEDAASSVVRGIEDRLKGSVIPAPARQREIAPADVPTAEFLFAAFRWLAGQGREDLIGTVYRGWWARSLILINWTIMLFETPGFDTAEPVNARLVEAILDSVPNAADRAWLAGRRAAGQGQPAAADSAVNPESPAFRMALEQVYRLAAAPVSKRIVDSLSKGPVSRREARDAFGAFACLAGWGPPIAGSAPACAEPEDRSRIRGTVERLEELQVMGRWLERLYRDPAIDTTDPVNAGVLHSVLFWRRRELAFSQVLQLLRAGEKNPRIDPNDARLALDLIAAQPEAIAESMRRELAAHPGADLTSRLPAIPMADEARRRIEADYRLSGFAQSVARGAADPGDLLEGLLVTAATRAELQADVLVLDRAGVLDALFDLYVARAAAPAADPLRQLLESRDPWFSVSTLRRLLGGKDVSETAIRVGYELQRSLPGDVLAAVVAADPALWQTLMEGLPADLVASPSFGPAVDPSGNLEFIRAALDDDSIWQPDLRGGLAPSAAMLLRLAIQAGLAPRIVDIVEAHWSSAVEAALGEMGFTRNPGGGQVRYIVVAGTLPEPDGGFQWLREFARMAAGRPVSAEGLLSWAAAGKGWFIDLEPPSGTGVDASGTLSARLRNGSATVQAKALSLRRSDLLFAGAAVRTGAGMVRDLDIVYRAIEKKNGRVESRLSAARIELQDIVIATRESVYGIGRLALSGVEARGDLATGRPIAAKMGEYRTQALLDLVYTVFDGVFTAVDLIAERFVQGRPIRGADELASALAARFEQRIDAGLTVRSVELEALVAPGFGIVESVRLGTGREGAPDGLAASLAGGADWDRLMLLRGTAGRGALSEEDAEELAVLERRALGMSLDLAVDSPEVRGVRPILIDASGRERLQGRLEALTAERASFHLRVDAVSGEAQEVPGTPGPLATLAAMDDGVFNARVTELEAVIEKPSVDVGSGFTAELGSSAAAVALRAAQGAIGAGRVETSMLPGGSLRTTARDGSIHGLVLEAPSFAARLELADVAAATTEILQLRTPGDAAGLALPPAFPALQNGDVLLRVTQAAAAGAALDIHDLSVLQAGIQKLSPAVPAAPGACDAGPVARALREFDGRLLVSSYVKMRSTGATGPAALTPVCFNVHLSHGSAFLEPCHGYAPMLPEVVDFFEISTGIPLGVRVPVEQILDYVLCGAGGGGAPGPVANSLLDALLRAGEFTRFSQGPDALTWKPAVIDAGAAARLSFDWDAAQRIPMTLRTVVTPGRRMDLQADLTIDPFELASITGHVKGLPVHVSTVRLAEPTEVDAAARLSRLSLSGGSIHVPLAGLSAGEIDLLWRP